MFIQNKLITAFWVLTALIETFSASASNDNSPTQCSEPEDDGLPVLTVTTEISQVAPGHGLWGDMVLPLDFFSNSSKNGSFAHTKITSDLSARWQGGVIPYEIHASLAGQTSLIRQAFREYHEKTCIRFVPRTRQDRNYIKIFFGEGCYSLVGMANIGEQPISLGQGCLYHGTVVHELGHAVGLFHEQNREDRDDYITIYWSNMQGEYGSQFIKVEPYDEILYTPYDLQSIMHYGERAFSKDGVSKTMEANDGTVLLEPYEKPGLTDLDVQEIQAGYGCQKV